MIQSTSFEVGAGLVAGRVDGDVVRALGIPYATAARFGTPTTVTRYDEPVMAFTRAPASPQRSSPLLARLVGSDDLPVDEHCQRLSVTVPADLADGERLPVIVWIHGGSYVTGAGDLAVYDPRRLVTEQRVVFVAVTYRLGVLGFLGDGADVPANLGLLDLLSALLWIRDNIEGFGGDPGSVTLAGQSAGADAIAHLMISDGAEGLFRRAIIQSAPLGITFGRSAMTTAMLAAVGVPPRDASADEVVARQALAEKAARPFKRISGMPFGVQYGLPPIPVETDRDTAWRKAAPHIDILIGCTREETAMIAGVVRPLEWLFRLPLLGRRARRALVTPSTRAIYDTPARDFARRHRAAGGHAVRYRMTWQPHGSVYGAAHITDLPLLLGTRESWEGTRLLGRTSWADLDRRGRAIRHIWAGFARTGTVPADAMTAAADTITFPED